MRTIVHLSDLHFGRIDAKLILPLTDLIKGIDPDLLVVSGDLTQRARSAQFKQARQFLDTLPVPQIVVPGNHDIPLHNLFNRFLRPLDKYRRYIGTDVEPVYIDDEIAVIGINTARSLTFKNGRINQQQIARLRAHLLPLGQHRIKIIVTHHPFDLPAHIGTKNLVGGAKIAMQSFAECGADLLLAGHLHASHAGSTVERYPINDYAALVVQAGTATSTRGRGETNSFNVVRIDDQQVTIERFGWNQERGNFVRITTTTFQRHGAAWLQLGGTENHAPL
ncbi:MAG: metallophosphoesterase [Glaciimonas sp.]|nr:metallophosphoesterase [Glaciimonas sp.]